jgi:hypothetical protein
MTAVEWLLEELKKVHHPTEAMIMYAKKLERQQIMDAHISGYDSSGESAKDYYDFYYGSKGSDEIKTN